MNAAIEQINQAIAIVAPEAILVATACLMFLVGSFLVTDSGQARSGLRHQFGVLALIALAGAAVVWLTLDAKPVDQGPFRSDQLLWIARTMSLGAGALVSLILWNQIDDAHAAEAQACLLAIVAGASLVAAANDLVTIFLALELVSIPTYVLLFLPRRNTAEREATVKYFLLSIFSSGLVLYGMAWLYGAAGTTNLTGISDTLTQSPGAATSGALLLAQGLLIAGLCFRMTAFPFHFYAPDVFQAVIPANAAMLSFVPKLVATVALLRLVPLTSGSTDLFQWAPTDSIRALLALIAVLSMFVGNLMAWRQKNLYRLLAYSGVANAGYLLVGFAVGPAPVVGSIHAAIFYLAVYGIMTIGAIALLSSATFDGGPLRQDSDLRGLSRTSPGAALLLAVCLLSLTGLPPTVGFFGKLNLFLAAWSVGDSLGRSLAICLALNAAIAAWYYLRLVALMYLEPMPESTAAVRTDWPSWTAGAVCAIATVCFFVAPQWLWMWLE
ncbi:MAG: NADH-quinone oxidoreductase subunit N [Pirellulales bacterium]